MGWVGFAFVVLAAFALMAVPGALVLWLLRVRDVRVLLLAPAVGLGVLGLLTFAAAPFGGWGWAYPSVLTALLGGAVVWQKVRENRTPGAVGRSSQHPWWPAVGYSLAGVVAFVAVYSLAIGQYWANPQAPQSYGDAHFHYQGSQLVWLFGDVSPLTAMAPIYDPVNPGTTYYPTLWHGIVSLLTDFSVTAEASNALIVAVGLIAWPLALSALALAVAPKQTGAAFWAPLIGAFLPYFPAQALFANAMGPFGLSVLSFPIGVAALIWWGRAVLAKQNPGDAGHGRPAWVWGSVFVFATIGAIASQPTTAVVLAIAVVACLVVLGITIASRRRRQGRRSTGVVIALVGGVGVLAAIVAIVGNTSYVQNLGSFERVGLGFRVGLIQLIKGAPLDPTRLEGSLLPWVPVVAIALAGMIILRRRFAAQVGVLTTVGALFVYLLACGPESPLRALTGIWYKDYSRLAIFVWALLLVFAAAAVSMFISALSALVARQGSLVGALVSVVLVAAFVVASNAPVGGPVFSVGGQVRLGYALDSSSLNHLDEDRVSILELIDDNFDEGVYVIGAPLTGAEFVASQGRQLSFLPLGTPKTPEQLLIATDLEHIQDDPRVCQVLNDANVEGLLVTDGAQALLDPATVETFDGLLTVDTDDGFELVGTSGPVSLYRITACD